MATTVRMATPTVLLVLVACGQQTGPCGLFVDGDADGFGDPTRPVRVCDPPAANAVADSSDCDDENAAVHPGAVESCDPHGVDENCNGLSDDNDPGVTGTSTTWPDADGDGFGDGTVPPSPACRVHGRATNDDDCNDAVPAIHPEGIEVFGDGVDQDCNGEDFWFLLEDVELGMPDPLRIASTAGVVDISDVHAGGFAASGRYAFELGSLSEVVTVPFDIAACEEAVTVSFYARRPPRSVSSDGATLALSYGDATGWVDIDSWLLADLDSWAFAQQRIILEPPNPPSYELRWSTSELRADERVLLDDLELACAGPDTDGDTWGASADCDDADADHWSDCGFCSDADGDGYGVGCDLGDDCDDSNGQMAPDVRDETQDGVDQDCDGMDYAFVDDMNSSPLWNWVSANTSSQEAHSPPLSMELEHYYEWAESVEFDTSGCDTVSWELWVLFPPNPHNGHDLYVRWIDAAGLTNTILSQSSSEAPASWTLYAGTIVGPTGTHDEFEINIDSYVPFYSPSIYVDDIAFRCGPKDADRDGVLAGVDCDDSDAAHWWDCQGLCVDADGDDHGEGCDLGPDANDSDPLIYG